MGNRRKLPIINIEDKKYFYDNILLELREVGNRSHIIFWNDMSKEQLSAIVSQLRDKKYEKIYEYNNGICTDVIMPVEGQTNNN